MYWVYIALCMFFFFSYYSRILFLCIDLIYLCVIFFSCFIYRTKHTSCFMKLVKVWSCIVITRKYCYYAEDDLLVINTNSTLDQIHVLKWIVILFFCLMHDLKKSRLVRSTVCFCEIMYVPWVHLCRGWWWEIKPDKKFYHCLIYPARRIGV
jgi:hypothetical protein